MIIEIIKNMNFMNDKFSSYNIKNDQFISNSKENDYKNLIKRLKEISETISLLEKKIFS